MVLPNVHQHNPDCDIWVHEYFTPSWFCLPNNQPALTVVRPGDTARDTLELICKVWSCFGLFLQEQIGCRNLLRHTWKPRVMWERKVLKTHLSFISSSIAFLCDNIHNYISECFTFGRRGTLLSSIFQRVCLIDF